MQPVKLDVHTHTIASGHAFSTLDEMVRAAAEKNLEVFGVAEHGPMMEGACEGIYFSCYHFVPRVQYGIRVLLGCELNILDDKGRLDLDQRRIDCLDLRIAGVHANKLGEFKQRNDPVYNTNAYLSCIKNPDIDIISHPDAIEADYETILKACKQYNTLPEINNNSLILEKIRPNAREHIVEILTLAKKLNVQVILSSDAHHTSGIARLDRIEKIIDDIDFPEELIINYRPKDFLDFIRRNHPVNETGD